MFRKKLEMLFFMPISLQYICIFILSQWLAEERIWNTPVTSRFISLSCFLLKNFNIFSRTISFYFCRFYMGAKFQISRNNNNIKKTDAIVGTVCIGYEGTDLWSFILNKNSLILHFSCILQCGTIYRFLILMLAENIVVFLYYWNYCTERKLYLDQRKFVLVLQPKRLFLCNKEKYI